MWGFRKDLERQRQRGEKQLGEMIQGKGNGGKAKTKKTEGENKERQRLTEMEIQKWGTMETRRETHRDRQTERDWWKDSQRAGRKALGWNVPHLLKGSRTEPCPTSRRDCCVGVPVLILIFASPRG